jgi:hypothetical protein
MKKLLYGVYLFIVVIVLIPKEYLYSHAENTLASSGVYLNDETLTNRWFYLDIEGIDIVSGHLLMGRIEQMDLSVWLIVNSLTLNSVSAHSEYKLFFPGIIEELKFQYALWRPLVVSVSGHGDFGECHGEIDLVERKIYIVFEAMPQLRRYPLLMTKLHKQQEGLVYEAAF